MDICTFPCLQIYEKLLKGKKTKIRQEKEDEISHAAKLLKIRMTDIYEFSKKTNAGIQKAKF